MRKSTSRFNLTTLNTSKLLSLFHDQLMEGYHNLSPFICNKIFTDWFAKFSGGYVVPFGINLSISPRFNHCN